jgi:hypothetical protein
MTWASWSRRSLSAGPTRVPKRCEKCGQYVYLVKLADGYITYISHTGGGGKIRCLGHRKVMRRKK